MNNGINTSNWDFELGDGADYGVVGKHAAAQALYLQHSMSEGSRQGSSTHEGDSGGYFPLNVHTVEAHFTV